MVSPAWLDKTPPSDEEVAAVINASGLQPFKPMFFPEREVPAYEGPNRSKRGPDAQRQQWIGPYYIAMERRGENSQIKLWLYDFSRGALNLKATWSGFGRLETDRQFNNVADYAKAAIIARTQKKL
jgi:hypothetical protein